MQAWIDALQDVWSGIQGRGFTTVRAPYLNKSQDYPDTIDPDQLKSEPIALSFPEFARFQASAGGPNEGFYRGSTDFHIWPNLDLDAIPYIMNWPDLIAQAAAANLKLGGLVENFILEERDDQITGPISLQFGNEAEHWGYVVHWRVKENKNASITVATGE